MADQATREQLGRAAHRQVAPAPPRQDPAAEGGHVTSPEPVPPQAMAAVAAAEREWKRRAALPDTETGYDSGRIRAMVEAAAPHLAAAEREACAQLAESTGAVFQVTCTMADCPCPPGASSHTRPFADLLRKDPHAAA